MPKNKLKRVLVDKLEMGSIIFFLLALFLLDVNVNMLAAYGPDVTVTVFGDKRVESTSMFWLGVIVAAISFFIFSARSMYKKQRIPSKLDLFFAVLGVLGLAIILSGGLLLFGKNVDLEIKFFNLILSRVNYYHIGIGLSLFSLFYFAMTK